MPHLNFVLPHWLYWGTLAAVSADRDVFGRPAAPPGVPRGPSLFIAYLFWICSGFMGLHRFYLRSMWGFAFIPVFLVILHVSDTIRDHREDVSRTRAAYEAAHIDVNRAKIPAGVEATPAMTERLQKAQADEAKAKTEADIEANEMGRWQDYSLWLALLMAAMLISRCRADAGACAARQRSAKPKSAPTRRRKWLCPTCRRSARTKTRRCICTRVSPTSSNGSTSGSANSSPIGR